ncbi:hypothetical protein NDU88_011596, partial [Pleurodeles waltl]
EDIMKGPSVPAMKDQRTAGRHHGWTPVPATKDQGTAGRNHERTTSACHEGPGDSRKTSWKEP